MPRKESSFGYGLSEEPKQGPSGTVYCRTNRQLQRPGQPILAQGGRIGWPYHTVFGKQKSVSWCVCGV